MCTTWWAPPLKEEGGGMDFLPSPGSEAIVMRADNKSTTVIWMPALETQLQVPEAGSPVPDQCLQEGRRTWTGPGTSTHSSGGAWCSYHQQRQQRGGQGGGGG
jgi:hypothetical protein